MTVHELSRADARRLAVRAQLLVNPRPSSLLEVVRHLTLLPMDMTDAIAPNVDLVAWSRIGSPYSWGGSGPSAFDCSGLVMWSFQQAGISLPHSSQALAQGGQPVSMDQMQPGDLVTYYSDASHVAIYIGDGMMVHASTYGTPVRVAPVDNAPIYNVRRY